MEGTGNSGNSMLTELAGLDLRRAACEALGIPCVSDGIGNPAVFLPAIESDPAVSEPMFLEWCVKNAKLANAGFACPFCAAMYKLGGSPLPECHKPDCAWLLAQDETLKGK